MPSTTDSDEREVPAVVVRDEAAEIFDDVSPAGPTATEHKLIAIGRSVPIGTGLPWGHIELHAGDKAAVCPICCALVLGDAYMLITHELWHAASRTAQLASPLAEV